ncbi:MAG TPA: SDR family NAD(P)-dependent oxidoreductase [Candidatus Baltobacteraceae bacterium]|nr:SDR family NAD(P)-dependent oxidoreductase [Candidatus Baltobacteraceae bacterium]
MRALITGGIGFIGTNLADRLLRDGHDVVLFDNMGRAGVEENLRWLEETHGSRARFVKGDVRDSIAVEKAMKGAEAVFHLAAQVAVTTSVANPQEDFSINAQGTVNVLEAARRQDPMPTFLYTSTNKVYGGLEHLRVIEGPTRYEFENLPDGVSEKCPLDFHSPYGCSKGAADQYVHDYHRIYGLPSVVFRMSCIFGPHQFGTEDQGWVAHFALCGLRGNHLTIYGDGKQVRDLLYVEDLVELMTRACKNIQRTAGQVYNVGGGPSKTISVWAELQDLLKTVVDKLPPVDYGEFRPGDQRIYVSDIRKAQEQLAWTPSVGIAEGLRRMVEAWRRDRKTATVA